jgi:hypothetical protein
MVAKFTVKERAALKKATEDRLRAAAKDIGGEFESGRRWDEMTVGATTIVCPSYGEIVFILGVTNFQISYSERQSPSFPYHREVGGSATWLEMITETLW